MQSAEAERRTEACVQPLRPSHPAEVRLESFLRGELSRAEVRPVVRHLLTGCPECLKVTRPFWALMQQEPKRLGGRRWRGRR